MDTALIVITVGSLAASFVNAAFATGGIYIMLLSTIAVLPVSAAVPLQSVFAAGSLTARVAWFWHHIRWRIVAMFVFGGVFGVFFGARTFVALPDALISLLLGLLLLALIWLPRVGSGLKVKYPFVYVGVAHGFLGTAFGVGGLLQPIILRTKLLKFEITGTLAACMIALDVMKVAGYAGYGFRYQDYVPHIALATVAGFCGTWLGRKVAGHVSERAFRTVFRWLITLVALRLVYGGWSAMAG